MTSTAGSLTPETVDLGTDIELQDLSDGQESRRSRSFRGSMMLETPRAQKRKVVMVPASIVTPTAEKVFCIGIYQKYQQTIISNVNNIRLTKGFPVLNSTALSNTIVNI